MKKTWTSRLEELEVKSKKLCAEERFDVWLSEHYPERNAHFFDYIAIMPKTPPEFRDVCLDRCFQELRNLQSARATMSTGIPDKG